MRRLPISAFVLGMAVAWPALADSIDDELNELNNLTTQQNQQAGAPNWCPPREITLLGVTSASVNLKPGDYLLVASTHPAGIKRGQLEQKLSPLLTQQREETTHAQWGQESITAQEADIGALLRKINDLQIEKNRSQNEDTRKSIQDDIDRRQRALSEANQRLANTRSETEQHAANAARLKGQTDPLLVQSEALYNEVVEASKQCPP